MGNPSALCNWVLNDERRRSGKWLKIYSSVKAFFMCARRLSHLLLCLSSFRRLTCFTPRPTTTRSADKVLCGCELWPTWLALSSVWRTLFFAWMSSSRSRKVEMLKHWEITSFRMDIQSGHYARERHNQIRKHNQMIDGGRKECLARVMPTRT